MEWLKLKKLIKDLDITVFSGNREVEVGGICSHSKKVCPGDLFIIQKGASYDGANFINEAVQTGALAILSNEGNPFLQGITQLIHPDISSIISTLSSRFYDNPSRELFVAGITGTNGKTTVSYLLKHLLERSGLKTGLIGTVEYIIGENHYPSDKTTPDTIQLQKLIREMRNNNCGALAMEVSSHGLVQRRVENIDFDIALFTNLTQDHLDYHKTMESYFEAKMQLFSNLAPSKWAVINSSSPYGEEILKRTYANTLSYGFEKEADLQAKEVILGKNETHFTATYQERSQSFTIPLLGRFNVLNVLAAASVMLTRGVSLSDIPPLLRGFQGTPGRLERVKNPNGAEIIVDFAHTPDALENVCRTLKEIGEFRKLIVVFGCGGDRDQDKRAKMGEVAARFADLAIITSDNPRSEDPLSICQEIAGGIRKGEFLIIPNRREAIETAIESAHSNDLILIAGKGHETYQIFSHQTLPFDDCKVAQNLIRVNPCKIS